MIEKTKDFFIALDSDGCVFDTMEIKHKECFCPATIKHFRLQSVSRYTREAWEYVNLYSRQRGTNRFPALVSVLDHLRVRPEVLARTTPISEVSVLRQWIAEEKTLGNPALQQAVARFPALAPILDWSREVNARISDMVHGIPPFPMVHESLSRASAQADMMVSSGTPRQALHREWGEHQLTSFVRCIAGQEDGRKAQHLTAAAAGRYAPARMLMVGDAPGDLEAAMQVRACFYPILPGQEAFSWQQFHDEALERFFTGRFGGAYQQSLISALHAALPQTPPWSPSND